VLKFIKYLLILLVIALACGFLYLNTIFKTKAQEMASKMTGTPVQLSYASVSPFKGTIVMGGVNVGNPKGFKSKHAIEFSSIAASVDIKSLLTDNIKIKNVTIKKPVIYYEVGVSGDNIRALLRNVKSSGRDADQASRESKTKKSVVIQDLYLNQPKVKLAADFFGLKADHEMNLSDIHLTNVGAKKGGASIENITGIVLKEISQELASIQAAGFKRVGDEIGKSAGDAIKKIGDLF
jgi:uncharacterized protein involved in outer membrane biogenesis